MKKITLLIIAAISLLSTAAFADGYKIKVKIDGLSEQQLLLGHHFGSKKYVVDTIKLDKKGAGIFQGDSLLDGGIYLVILPSMSYFELLIDKDQDFALETDTVDLIKGLKFTGNDLNTHFKEYQEYMVAKQKESGAIRKRYTTHSEKAKAEGVSKSDKKMHEDSVEILREQLVTIDKEIKSHWDEVIAQNKGSVLASILTAMKDIEVPDPPKDENGNITDSLFQYNYYKNHYFDNIDFSDARLLRTPLLENKIEQFLKRAVVQHPDSLVAASDLILKKAQANKEVFKFALQHLFNKYNDTKIMCMDKIFVHLAENYYLTGKADWAINDSAFINKLYDRYMKMKDNVCGVKATELVLRDTLGNVKTLHSIQAKYTVLYFYDPECGHCKKIIPKWAKAAKKYKGEQVATVFVSTQIEKDKWTKFINKYGISEFYNLYDPTQSTNFRIHYDIYSTPVPYILNENKEIMAKRLSPDVIEDFLDNMLTRDGIKVAPKVLTEEDAKDDHASHGNTDKKQTTEKSNKKK